MMILPFIRRNPSGTPRRPGAGRRVCCWVACLGMLAGVSLPAAAPTRTGAGPRHLIDAWETDQGLPENSTRQMVQTPDGYLWFGTMGGLVRFDGVGFKTFVPANAPGLPSEGIIYLHLDASQRLWVSTLEGLAVSEPGRWTTFRQETRWTANYVRNAAERDGVTAFVSFDGRVFRATATAFDELARPPGAAGQTFFVHVDRGGQIWGVRRGFYGRWDGQQWVSSAIESEVAGDFRGAGPGRDGGLITYGSRQLLRLEGDRVTARVPLAEVLPPAWQLTEDRGGVVWLPTWGQGLYSISPDGAIARLGTRQGLLSDSLRFVFEDAEQNLWTGGGNGGGLIRLKPRTVKTLGQESGLPERIVKAVAEEKSGTILVGTYGQGLARWDGRSVMPLPAEVTAAVGAYLQCLLVDQAGTTWLGTYGNGLHRMEGKAIKSIPPAECGGRNINGVFEDSRHRIWIGGSEDAVLFANGTFTPQRLPDGGKMPHLFAFAEAPGGQVIWAANDQALYQFADGAWREVKEANGNRLKGVLALHTEPDGALWVGGIGAGLKRLQGGRWTHLGEECGLPPGAINSILEDRNGHWWMGSSNGIVRVAQAELEAVANRAGTRLNLQLFTTSDGLNTLEVAPGFSSTSLRDRNGRLWFATPRGVALIQPDDLRLNLLPPPLVLESVGYIDGQENRHSLVPAPGQKLVLPAGSRKLEARFAVLSFRAPEKVLLRHRFLRNGRLVSEDQQNGRTFQSDLLIPGRYSLAMTAANNDGIWNNGGVTLDFEVEPHFWQTLWFECGIVLLIAGGLGVGLWRVDRNRGRRREEALAGERALAREHALLASVLEGTTDFVAFISPEGRTTYVNPAGRTLAGLRADENVTALRLSDFLTPEAAVLLNETAVPQAVAHGAWRGESTVRQRDGRLVPVSQVLVAHRGTAGELMFVSTIMRDITEQRAAQESARELNASLEDRVARRTVELAGRVAEVERLNGELQVSQRQAAAAAAELQDANRNLRAANEELEAFSYSVSHDLRAPLRNISGFMELLTVRSAGRLDPEGERFVQTVQNEAARMGRLISDLLEFSRIGRAAVSLEAVELNELIDAERAGLEAGLGGRILEWKIAPLPPVRGDRNLLRLVVANLLSNAVKFTARRPVGVIEIGTVPGDPADPLVTIFIRDNGAGFDPRYVDKLFGVFQRLHNQRDFEGTGIGLANVKRIVTRLGGQVRGEGKVDNGAVFYLKLPGHQV